MFRMIVATFLALSIFAVSPSANAAVIGVINIQKIMESSKAAKPIRQQLKSKQKKFQAKLDKKQKQLLAEDKKLAKQHGTLAKDAFEKKVKEFQKRAETAKKEIAAKRRELDKAFTKALKQIEDKVIAIGEAVAKDKGYSIVISASQVLYSDSSMDITQAVLATLDKELPIVSI